MTPGETCQNCRHFAAHEASPSKGLCLRYPPTAVAIPLPAIAPGRVTFRVQPIRVPVRATEGCGEFEPTS